LQALLNSRANGGHGVVFWGKGLRLRVLSKHGGDGIDGGWGLLVIERGAAHSNTQGKRDKLRIGFLDRRESTRRKGGQK